MQRKIPEVAYYQHDFSRQNVRDYTCAGGLPKKLSGP